MDRRIAGSSGPGGDSASGAAPPQIPAARSVRATAAAEAPVLDGREDDAVWRATPVVDQFLQAKPSEGAAARFRTEARLAYDARNLYVFVRAFDPHPDSIISLLSRRDEQTASDHVILLLDPYHDRRTGYEFVVTPGGVKTDYAIFNDGNEDVAWDGVWDVATRRGFARLDRRVPDPAVAAPLLGEGRRHLRPAALAGHPAARRDGDLAAVSAPRGRASPRSSAS